VVAAVTLFANGLNALEAISPKALQAVEAAGTAGSIKHFVSTAPMHSEYTAAQVLAVKIRLCL